MSFLPLAIGGLALAQLAAEALPWSLRPLFQEAADQAGAPVDVPLLMALAWKESGFDAAAVGAANPNGTRDYGLLQINSANLERFGLTPDSAVTDPVANTRAAASLLAELAPHARNRGDLISMYNAGQDKATGGPKLITTPDGSIHYVNAPYVDDVLVRYWFVRVADLAPLKRGA